MKQSTSTPKPIFKKPNPPTPEAIQKAKFIDKTFNWNGR